MALTDKAPGPVLLARSHDRFPSGARLLLRRNRPLVKTGTWRIIGGATTFLLGTSLGYRFTGDLTVSVAEGGAIGLFDANAKVVLSHLHERLWDRQVPLPVPPVRTGR